MIQYKAGLRLDQMIQAKLKGEAKQEKKDVCLLDWPATKKFPETPIGGATKLPSLRNIPDGGMVNKEAVFMDRKHGTRVTTVI